MPGSSITVDVLCVGTAVYDLVFSIDHHPASDEKMVASSLVSCGGGPAANAAVTVCRLGNSAAFAGYLGRDPFGDLHHDELVKDGVLTDLIIRGSSSTPLSAILVKPGGDRTVANYREHTRFLEPDSIDLSRVRSKVILFDGHEPSISTPLAKITRERGIPLILDAGSVHQGTKELVEIVDHLLCSEKFALDFTGVTNAEAALPILSGYAPNVVITLGERGLIWRNEEGSGHIQAYKVNVVDTTGAGDAFHGAYAAGLVKGWVWPEILRFASATAALCCTTMGARRGLPRLDAVQSFLAHTE